MIAVGNFDTILKSYPLLARLAADVCIMFEKMNLWQLWHVGMHVYGACKNPDAKSEFDPGDNCGHLDSVRNSMVKCKGPTPVVRLGCPQSSNLLLCSERLLPRWCLPTIRRVPSSTQFPCTRTQATNVRGTWAGSRTCASAAH
jgi:hypothetical protein